MAELQSVLNGINRKKKVLSYTVDLIVGVCLVKTEVTLDWSGGDGAKCLSTSYEDVEILLKDFPEMDAALDIVYKKISSVDEIYAATKVEEVG